MRLTTIEKKIKTNIEKFITNSIEWVEDSEKEKARRSYYYIVETNKEDNRIEISFDGGMIYDTLNYHGYIDDESVEEIFGISKSQANSKCYGQRSF